MGRTADLECILGAQRLRQIFKCLGFAFLFVWILFGNYGPRVEENRVRTRKLLSLQLPQNFSGNDDIEVRRESERQRKEREKETKREREKKRERVCQHTSLYLYSVVKYMIMMKSSIVTLSKKLTLVEEMKDLLPTLSLFTVLFHTNYYLYQ